MFRSAFAALSLLALGACTTVQHKPITQETLAQVQGKSVATTSYAKPDFTAFTAGKAAFAMIGAALMISEGNGIVRDNEIPDPAVAITEGLSEKLKAAKSVTVLASKGETKSDDVAAIVAANPDAQYILDYKTLNWLFVYYPSDWSHYKVNYVGRLRLIDAGTKSVAAESACTSTQGDDKNPPDKDQLLADKAALLKSYLSKAASQCIEVLSRDVLRL
jgi:hypothetical protein